MAYGVPHVDLTSHDAPTFGRASTLTCVNLVRNSRRACQVCKEGTGMSMNEAERSSALSGDANRAGAGVTNEDSPVRVVVLASEPIVLEQIRTALTDRRIQLRVAENQTESMALLESW